MKNITVDISLGELADRLTILELKLENSTGEKKSKVTRELNDIKSKYHDAIGGLDEKVVQDVVKAFHILGDINSDLWDIEDRLRVLEKDQDFGPEFVSLARSVYRTNDLRSQYKGLINEFVKSDIHEVKVFSTDGE